MQAAKLASKKVLSHLFESERSAKIIARMAVEQQQTSTGHLDGDGSVVLFPHDVIRITAPLGRESSSRAGSVRGSAHGQAPTTGDFDNHEATQLASFLQLHPDNGGPIDAMKIGGLRRQSGGSKLSAGQSSGAASSASWKPGPLPKRAYDDMFSGPRPRTTKEESDALDWEHEWETAYA